MLPGAPSHDDHCRSAALVHIHWVVGGHTFVIWTGKDTAQVAKLRSLPITDAQLLELWKTGIPLSLPLLERARSARRAPRRESELSPRGVPFAAIGRRSRRP